MIRVPSAVVWAALAVLEPFTAFCGTGAVRIFRAPLYARGNAGMTVRYEIERAAWISHPEATNRTGEVFLRFRREFESDGSPFEIDVSADERYVLVLDGAVISRGPHRGTVENWLFQSYRLEIPRGAHVLEATVWSGGEKAPRGQLTYRTAFLLKASGAYDGRLTTGKAEWRVGELTGTRFTDFGKSRCFGGGMQTLVRGTGLLDEQPTRWVMPATVLPLQGETVRWGVRRAGWLLYPSQLPDQIDAVSCPGRVVEGGSLTGIFPAGTRKRILWDLGDYHCGYPVLKAKGGRGARVTWGWAEALKDKEGLKHERGDWRGLDFIGFGDTFETDGRDAAVFTSPWWRCGRWCELVVETGDEALEIRDVRFHETRYPLAKEWSFESSDGSLDEVLAICRRGIEMCTHETLFDCPFYEQQMYPGDGRVELQLLGACSRDRRMIARCIEIFDHGRRNDGFVPMNFPCRLHQESATFSMCYVLMYGDFLRAGGFSPAWLKARIPGLRNTMAALQGLENADGLLVGLPSWTFVDWVPEWNHGEAPDGNSASRPSSIQNLFWVLAMQSAAMAERTNGDEAQARYWETHARRTFDAVKAGFWDEVRGLFADDLDHEHWSEHAQILAMLSGLMERDDEDRAFATLVSAPDLARATVYFSHYLFCAYFRHGRGDLFLKKLDLWRDYVRLGLKTPLESPGNARSDCHAWGSHPIYHALTGLAGIRSGGVGFKSVEVRPSPGPLSFVRAKVPHPNGGDVSVDLRFEDGKAVGTVSLPEGLPGTFVWKGEARSLSPGVNRIGD